MAENPTIISTMTLAELKSLVEPIGESCYQIKLLRINLINIDKKGNDIQ